MISNHLEQVISTPTRVTFNSKTLIDHAYVSNPENITDISVPIYGISDHYPICITRKCPKSSGSKQHKFMSYRDLKNLNTTTFMGDMFNAPWTSIDATSSPKEALTVPNIFQLYKRE